MLGRLARPLARQVLASQPYQSREGNDYQREAVGPLAVLRQLVALVGEDGESKWNQGEEVRCTFSITGLAVPLQRPRFSPTGGSCEY